MKHATAPKPPGSSAWQVQVKICYCAWQPDKCAREFDAWESALNGGLLPMQDADLRARLDAEQRKAEALEAENNKLKKVGDAFAPAVQ